LSEALHLIEEKEITETQARDIGRRVLWAAGVFTKELGVNDPLTHLEQYLKYGEAAMNSVDEDLITDIAERRLKPTFVNPVKFDRVGTDFISRENKFSMRRMTAITEQKFSQGGAADINLYKRAQVESKEVARLNEWFDSAETNDVFIVESMGLTKSERYTIVRIHQKTGQGELVEHVVTLHNASVDIFNLVHDTLNAAVPDSQTPLELLDNMYAYKPDSRDFAEEYVSLYDAVLSSQNSGQEYSFGLPKAEKPKAEDDVVAIRRQTALRAVYLDSLKALGDSGGYVTPKICEINRGLGGEMELLEGSTISLALARELLDRSLQSVVATFNRASPEQLASLAANQDKLGAMESAGHYGGEARSEGVRYDGACPSGAGAAAGEAAAAAMGHKFNKDPSQCGTCPQCKKEYYVPDKLYKNKILSCNNCRAAIHFGGGKADQKIIDEYYGNGSKNLSAFDILSIGFRKAGLEISLNRLAKKQKTSETEFERRHTEKMIQEQYLELETLRQAA
jgi:hypothetical protein